MIKEGAKAPAFELESWEGKASKKVKLADYAGKTVVLFFYPRDMTPGCTREARGFRDAAAELKKRGAVVLGVSRDSMTSHAKFCDAEKLDFPLLSDPTKKVHEAYGAWGEKTSYGKTTTGVIRTTVVIGPDGKVQKVFPNVKVDGHVEKVLAAIDAAKG